MVFSSPPFYERSRENGTYRNRELYANCEPLAEKFMNESLIPITKHFIKKGVVVAWYVYQDMAEWLTLDPEIGPWRKQLRFKARQGKIKNGQDSHDSIFVWYDDA